MSTHGRRPHVTSSPTYDPGQGTPILRLQQVEKQYVTRRGTVAAVLPSDLEIAKGDFLGIVGPSGCGKSTLLSIIAGLDRPSGGQVLMRDEPMSGPGPDRCVVFQRFALFPTKTVAGNVGFGLRMAGVPKAERKQRVSSLIEQVGLDGFENAYPHELSGGMQQRVALARALIVRPEVLLMDEPFGALDAQTRITMQEEIARLARELDLTVLLVTHSVDEAVYLCNRVIVMTARPGGVKEEVAIAKDTAWKRGTVDEAMLDPEFASLHSAIWRSVREEMSHSTARP
ncbi:ABC transporter ATP-binding protein [Aeromicrobium sp. CF4.19]|uniref:ABC transporter ATP-binding protein n=1 Tax=Aeromicrobium sp. CF4.19 TaxID=3373082 RepID=UPI003EE6B0C7